MQGTLEKAIKEVTGETVTLTAAGRTDAGAHASHQVISFLSRTALSPEALLKALNARLPHDIAVSRVAETDPEFHPRFDPVGRTYRYLVWNRPVRSPFWHGRATHVKLPLDAEAMSQAASELVGERDMTSFIPAAYDGDPNRTIYRAEVSREGDLITIELEATGFMRQMVRSIAGTLINVGLGVLSVEEFSRILFSKRRDLAGDTAPAEGLYLFDVRYRNDPASLQHLSEAAGAISAGSTMEKS